MTGSCSSSVQVRGWASWQVACVNTRQLFTSLCLMLDLGSHKCSSSSATFCSLRLYSLGWPWIYYVAKAGFELATSLGQI